MILEANRLHTVKEYYFSEKLREVANLKSQGKPVINMAIGSPDLEPPIEVIQAIKNTVTLKGTHQYQSYQGIDELRKAISEFYEKKYGVSLNYASQILPLMGSKEGIMLISLAFLNKGDKVLIPNPGYPTYTAVTELVEAQPVYYDLSEQNSWLPNVDALEKEDLKDVKLMWVNYPHMPTGASANEQFFKNLVAFAKKHQILIVNDNPYSFILNKKPLSIFNVAGAMDVALELNSISKTFNMAGWRVGMLLGKSQLLKTVLKVKSNMDSGMFLGIQKGAVEALKLSNSWIEKQNKIYETRRKLVWEIFDAIQCTYSKSSSGLFVWGKIPLGLSAVSFSNELLYQLNFFLAPGTVFGTNGKGYVRASLCIDESEMKKILNRVKTAKNKPWKK